MPQNHLTGSQLKEMLIAACSSLEKSSDQINSLNIFPVPDGDTGTNMSLTLKAAVNEVLKVNENSISKIAAAAAKGSLMGARGNSGVILSQLIRGLAIGFADKIQATPIETAKAMEKGVEVAYQAVMKPVEGTILTVAREAAKEALLAAYKYNDLTDVLNAAYQKGLITLEKTPDMLPVLKQAQVVDAGGKGFLVIYESFLATINNSQDIVEQSSEIDSEKTFITTTNTLTYCTEFLIKGHNLPVENLRHQLTEFGDSLMVVSVEDIIKVHIHTNNPGLVLELCLKLGSLHEIHINNMQEQMEEANKDIVEATKPFGVVAVSLGNGLNEIFTSLGVDEVVSGGQTMNPSTEELLKAVEKVPANKVFLLPNNKNVLLAAEQIASLTSKEVKVIPTSTFPQGISAMLSYEKDTRFSLNAEKMTQSMDKVLTGEVTAAARESNLGNMNIQEGDILGISEGEIRFTGKNIEEITRDLIISMLGNSRELVTIFYGLNINKETATQLVADLSDEFPEIEFELHYGGQPLYYYIISVE